MFQFEWLYDQCEFNVIWNYKDGVFESFIVKGILVILFDIYFNVIM